MRSNVFVRMPVRVINYRHLVSLLSICARIIENVSALHICFMHVACFYVVFCYHTAGYFYPMTGEIVIRTRKS